MDRIRAERLFCEMEANSVVIGGWRIVSLLGNGKSAVVFGAERRGEVCALKVMDPEVVERFGYESQKSRIELQKSLINCEHPNLVRIFDAGECDKTGHLYVAMEKLPYRALSDLAPTFPLENVVPLMMQVVSAGKYLEELGMAHRDIKPENIVVSDDLKHAVLLDFGVVKPLVGRVDNGTGGELLGTLRYSPPEFALGTHADDKLGYRAITFYQIGAVLYDIIMGKPMFQGIDIPFPKLCESIQDIDLVVEREGVPEHLLSLVRHCLIKDPSARLELVSWERFEAMPGYAESMNNIASVKEQIRRHRVEASASQYNPPESREYMRADDVVELIESLARSVCVSSPVFPPVEVKTYMSKQLDWDVKDGLVVLRSGPSNTYGLFNELVIGLRIQFDSKSAGVVHIEAAALAGSPGARLDRNVGWKKVCSSTLDVRDIHGPLEMVLHTALLAACQLASSVDTAVELQFSAGR